MTKLLYDLLFAQPLGGAKFHGGGEYMKSVFKELTGEDNDEVQLCVCYDQDAFLDDWIKKILDEKNIPVYPVKNTRDVEAVLLEKGPFDVFYTGMPYQYSRGFAEKSSSVKKCTFHGLRAVECPHDRYEALYLDSTKERTREQIRAFLKDTRWGYERSSKIAMEEYRNCLSSFDEVVCVSKHTRYSMKVCYPEIKTTVFYSPAKETDAYEPEIAAGDYILIVSGNRWIKNSYRALLALSDLYRKGLLSGVRTVVTGSVNERIRSQFQDLKQIEFLDYVGTKELEDLYAGCRIFLYPTLNEGFGYPPIEAMHYGKTCIVSGVCSVPELCGSAVYYVNPYDVREIENRILQALDHPIPGDKVQEQYRIVHTKQRQDLKELCRFIVA